MKEQLKLNIHSINENSQVEFNAGLQSTSCITYRIHLAHKLSCRTHSKMTERIVPERRRSMVALGELGHSAYNSGVGVPIPKRRPSCCYTPLTPSSPTPVLPYHPYSSQSPSSRIPEPPSKLWPISTSRRRIKPLRSFVSPQTTKGTPIRRPSTDAMSTYLAPTFSTPSRPGSFIDASSYECIPDSPAKQVLPPIRLCRLYNIVASSIYSNNNPDTSAR